MLRENILKENNYNVDYTVNTIIDYLYTVRPNSAKKTLWACFGDIMIENLKKNLEEKGNICPICGKRFVPKRATQNYCSDNCYNIAKNKREKERFCHKEQ